VEGYRTWVAVAVYDLLKDVEAYSQKSNGEGRMGVRRGVRRGGKVNRSANSQMAEGLWILYAFASFSLVRATYIYALVLFFSYFALLS